MSLRLRVAIDGRSLSGHRTGVGTYTANLVEELLGCGEDIEITLIHGGGLPALPWLRNPGLRVREEAARPRTGNFIWSNVALRRAVRSVRPGLLHSPGYTLPLRPPCPCLVTLHDVSYEACPRWYPYPAGRLRRAWYRSAARQADLVLTDSEFSRREILRVYGLPGEKVVAIPLGVDRRRFRRDESPATQQALKKKYQLPEDFLLFVGDIHPRRNVDGIAAALEALRLRRRESRDLGLVLVGRLLEGVGSRGAPAIAASGLVRHLGYVPEEELPAFYSLARAFVFPSYYEGFGLGVLEAMACGCPAVVGRGTSCEEVAGAAAVAVNPADVRSIADGIETLVLRPDRAAWHVEQGLRRAERFSWSRTARETLSAYRRVLRASGTEDA